MKKMPHLHQFRHQPKFVVDQNVLYFGAHIILMITIAKEGKESKRKVNKRFCYNLVYVGGDKVSDHHGEWAEETGEESDRSERQMNVFLHKLFSVNYARYSSIILKDSRRGQHRAASQRHGRGSTHILRLPPGRVVTLTKLQRPSVPDPRHERNATHRRL